MRLRLRMSRHTPLLRALALAAAPALFGCSGEDDGGKGRADGISSQGGAAGSDPGGLGVGGRAGRSGGGQGGEAGAAGQAGAAGEAGAAGQAGAGGGGEAGAAGLAGSGGEAGGGGLAGAGGADPCGNGKLDAGEQCDGSEVDSQACVAITGGLQDAQLLGPATCVACKLVDPVCISCDDGKQNGAESDVDCGGGPGACRPCGLGKNCDLDGQTRDEDCASGRCTDDHVCAPAFPDATVETLGSATVSTFASQLLAGRFRAGAPFDDLVFHDTQSSSVMFLRSDATGKLTTPLSVLSGALPGALVRAAQLGPDTNLDLLVANADPGMPSVQILFGVGDGNFSAPVTIFLSDFTPITGIIAGALTTGGSIDLAITTTQGVHVLQRTGATSFAPHPTIPFTPHTGTPSGLAFVDVDDDGDLDLFVTRASDQLLLRTNDGKGGLLAATTITGASAAGLSDIHAGVFRPQESRPSLLFPRVAPRNGFTIELASPNGNGIDASGFPSPALTTRAKPPKIVTADFDGTNGLDFLSYGPSEQAELWGNVGNGTFEPFDLGFETNELTRIALGGSSKPDLAYVDRASGALKILRNAAIDPPTP